MCQAIASPSRSGSEARIRFFALGQWRIVRDYTGQFTSKIEKRKERGFFFKGNLEFMPDPSDFKCKIGPAFKYAAKRKRKKKKNDF